MRGGGKWPATDRMLEFWDIYGVFGKTWVFGQEVTPARRKGGWRSIARRIFQAAQALASPKLREIDRNVIFGRGVAGGVWMEDFWPGHGMDGIFGAEVWLRESGKWERIGKLWSKKCLVGHFWKFGPKCGFWR